MSAKVVGSFTIWPADETALRSLIDQLRPLVPSDHRSC